MSDRQLLDPVTGSGRGSGSPGRRSRRRAAAAVVLTVGLLALVGAVVGWPVSSRPLWSALTAGTVVGSALALATFVPRTGEGWRPDVGCAPCAAVGAILAVVGPWLAVATAFDGGRAALGLALAGAALARRLSTPPTCATP